MCLQCPRQLSSKSCFCTSTMGYDQSYKLTASCVNHGGPSAALLGVPWLTGLRMLVSYDGYEQCLKPVGVFIRLSWYVESRSSIDLKILWVVA